MSFKLTSNLFINLQKKWKTIQRSELLICADWSDECITNIFPGSINKKISDKSTRTYYDTQEGNFFKEGLRLYSIGDDNWILVDKGGSMTTNYGSTDLSASESSTKLTRALKNKLVPMLTVEIDGSDYIITVGDETCDLIIQKTAFVSIDEKIRRKGPVCVSFDPMFVKPANANAAIELLKEQCKAVHISGDILTNGLISLGLPLPGNVLSEFFTIQKNDSIRQGMEKIVMNQTYRIWTNTNGTIKNLDPEYLHDMRVATRRLRSALRFVREFFDEYYCEYIRSELAWIADMLGKVRDMDVFIEKLRKTITLLNLPECASSSIIKTVASQHEAHRKSLVKAIKSKRFTDLMDRLANFGLQAFFKMPGNGGNLSIAARSTISKALNHSLKAVERTGDNAEDDAMHRLRISLKRLRYSIEFFSPIFEGEIKAVIKRIVEYQDCLGEHQDSIVATERLKSLFFSIPLKEKRQGAVTCLAELINHYKGRIDSTRIEFLSIRTNFNSMSDLLTSIIRGSNITLPEGQSNGKENNSKGN